MFQNVLKETQHGTIAVHSVRIVHVDFLFVRVSFVAVFVFFFYSPKSIAVVFA